MPEKAMQVIGDLIADALESGGSEVLLARVKKGVTGLCAEYELYK
jgi:glycine/serine hydroxymethyltransferase